MSHLYVVRSFRLSVHHQETVVQVLLRPPPEEEEEVNLRSEKQHRDSAAVQPISWSFTQKPSSSSSSSTWTHTNNINDQNITASTRRQQNHSKEIIYKVFKEYLEIVYFKHTVKEEALKMYLLNFFCFYFPTLLLFLYFLYFFMKLLINRGIIKTCFNV